MASWHQGRYPKERRRVCHARIQVLLNAVKNRWVQFTSIYYQVSIIYRASKYFCDHGIMAIAMSHGHSPGIDRGHLLVPFRKEFGCSVPGFVDRLCLKTWDTLIHGICPGAQNPCRCIHILIILIFWMRTVYLVYLKPEQTTSFFEGKNFYRVSNKHHVC